MKKNYKLNNDGIQQALDYIKRYRMSLEYKNAMFCDLLAEYGIRVAKAYITPLNDVGNVGSLIAFRKDVQNKSIEGCKTLLIAQDSMYLAKSWLGEGGVVKTAYLSAIDLYEFGTGAKADSDAEHIYITHPKHPVGEGTFPSETNTPIGNENHAKNGYWSWMGLDGRWYTSNGITPTMPMYHAFLDMRNEIYNVAKGVYSFE